MKQAILISCITFLLTVGSVIYYHETGEGTYEIHPELEEKYPALQQTYEEKIVNETEITKILEKGEGRDLCINKQQATKVLYDKQTAKRGYIGGWGATYVLDCQTEYYIYYQGDAGFKLYGPF